MEGKRLIVPKRPHHHRQRAITFLVIGLLAVVGVWGVQMKVTFAEFAKEHRENTSLARTARQLEAGLAEIKPSEQTLVEVGAFAESIKAALEAAQTEQTVAEAEATTAPTTETAASGEGSVAAFPPAAPEGVVAGEQTEASN